MLHLNEDNILIRVAVDIHCYNVFLPLLHILAVVALRTLCFTLMIV